MTTKNIVNIQNNRLDFFVNGTNRFDVILKGTNFLEVNELGYIIAQQTTADTTSDKSAGTYDFLGFISNIDNHNLNNLGDVVATNLQANQLLQYDGTSWLNVDTSTIGATELQISDGTSTSALSLNTDTLNILGTANEIETSLVTGSIQIGLTNDVIIQDTLRVGTNQFSAMIKDSTDSFILTTFSDTTSTNYIVKRNSNGETFINSSDGKNLNFGVNDVTYAYISSTDFYVVNDIYVGGTSSIIRGEPNGEFRLLDKLNGEYTHYYYDHTGGIAMQTPNAFVVNYRNGGTNSLKFKVTETLTEVYNNLTVKGNLIVQGTNTILNTEVKLIEDPLIELNYLDSAYTGTSDIGFFGKYNNDNYTGFFYDTSSTNFKVFNSLSTNAYSQTMKNIETTNISYVPILASTFEVEGGYVGKDVYTLSNTTSTATINVITELLTNYYSGSQGIYCGRLIAYSHGNGYRDHAITTINYNMIEDANTVSTFIATTDLEIKNGAHNYLSYNESNKTISYSPPTNANSFTPVVKFRILPIVKL